MLKYLISFRNRVDDGPEAKPVIEVFNQAPFIYQNRNFVSLNGEKVFEIFNIDKKDQGNYSAQPCFELTCNWTVGFAKEINLPDLPFILNWGSGVQAKNMQVDDVALMTAMTEMINCFDELQPNIPGEHLFTAKCLCVSCPGGTSCWGQARCRQGSFNMHTSVCEPILLTGVNQECHFGQKAWSFNKNAKTDAYPAKRLKFKVVKWSN